MKAVCVKDLHGQAATAGGGQTHFVQAGKSARGSTSTLGLQCYSVHCYNCAAYSCAVYVMQFLGISIDSLTL